ncbi:hypothetical protein BGX38DRAFT_1199235 [Terfezia claveryi]|nr:hypothetical protein BGX38DRAFT_1199235 [Terfezia claveryi]
MSPIISTPTPHRPNQMGPNGKQASYPGVYISRSMSPPRGSSLALIVVEFKIVTSNMADL